MRMRHVVVAGAIAAVGLAALEGSTLAQEKATGIVAYRQAVMRANGGHAGALQVILTDQTQLMEAAEYHAEAIKEAAEYLPQAFPKDSLQPASNALPVIWERWDEFQAAARRLEELAEKVVETSKTGDVQATLAAFGAMGKDGCGACHDTFRKKPPA
jgi:cytochrome c556